MQRLQPAQPHRTPRPITPHQKAVYTQIRHATAMASGLEAMATQAMDASKPAPQQLDYIVDLAAHLTDHLNDLAAAYAELPDND